MPVESSDGLIGTSGVSQPSANAAKAIRYTTTGMRRSIKGLRWRWRFNYRRRASGCGTGIIGRVMYH